MKILYLNYIPSPYRIDFFNKLANYCELKVVYYNSQIAERPSWEYSPEDHHYEHFILCRKDAKIQIKGYLRLLKVLAKNTDHIIIVGGYARPEEILAIAWLRKHQIPFILNTDGGFFQGTRFKLKVKRWLIKSARYYLANGSISAKTLELYGAPIERIYNYHFSSIFQKEIRNTTPEEKSIIRHKLQMPEKARIIITIGRYIPLKGFGLVIKALHLMQSKNTYLYMLGEGPLRDEYEVLRAKFNLDKQVVLSGQKSKNDVLEFCQAADCMILPTLSADVWGLVVNEAMSCGLPVIASDRVGAAYDMIKQGKTGYIVHAGDEKAIAEAIHKIDSTDMTSNTIEMAKKYTIEQMVEDHMILFRKMAIN